MDIQRIRAELKKLRNRNDRPLDHPEVGDTFADLETALNALLAVVDDCERTTTKANENPTDTLMGASADSLVKLTIIARELGVK